jgi:hypothetical protein
VSATIVYSWQSDIRAAACRTLIHEALEGTAAKIAQDRSVGIEPVIDRDTQNARKPGHWWDHPLEDRRRRRLRGRRDHHE